MFIADIRLNCIGIEVVTGAYFTATLSRSDKVAVNMLGLIKKGKLESAFYDKNDHDGLMWSFLKTSQKEFYAVS